MDLLGGDGSAGCGGTRGAVNLLLDCWNMLSTWRQSSWPIALEARKIHFRNLPFGCLAVVFAVAAVVAAATSSCVTVIR